jgi:hypothetical protein
MHQPGQSTPRAVTGMQCCWTRMRWLLHGVGAHWIYCHRRCCESPALTDTHGCFKVMGCAPKPVMRSPGVVPQCIMAYGQGRSLWPVLHQGRAGEWMCCVLQGNKRHIGEAGAAWPSGQHLLGPRVGLDPRTAEAVNNSDGQCCCAS